MPSVGPSALLALALLASPGAGVALAEDQGPAAAQAAAAPNGAGDPALPVPPVPPRVANGADYEACLAMLSDDPQGAESFAEVWAAKGGGDGAAHCRALAEIALGSPEAGAAQLDTLAAASTAPQAARAMIFGQAEEAWMMASAPARAFDSATRALALKPDDADLLIARATAAMAMGGYADAIEDLNRALEIDPRRADALVLRGSAWRSAGKLDLAAADIDHAIDIDPDDPEALLERGILRQRRGDRSGARADWERAIDLDPDSDAAALAQQDLALLDAGPDRR
ncbi:MAG: tetratricopeptide repeat protein [Proteobacteria bacterium]|nr:tetratricopeptide repeat protein [Pseudomonadota bacterium]